ncbi:MAG: M48 family metallopeptidase [Rhodoferax sp.]|nr:M48 family metallopeptidase [Rhodoferax sp.]
MPEPISHPSSLFTLVFAVALAGSLALKFWLATRQVRHVAAHRIAVPAVFADRIGLQAHQKAADYTVAKTRFGMLELAWGVAVALGWTLLGGLNALNEAVTQQWGPGLLAQVALIGAFTLLNALIDIPFGLYGTFVIEQRFGFNKTSFKLWLQDLGKSALLGLVIGGPLLLLILWLMGAAGPSWWIWTWAVWMGFNLLAMLIYPAWIAPWFNKFQPLNDAPLTARVQALMQRCGFRAQGFYVMDGSKRSAHANAYFTGFGASKRVVFYDTLLARLSADEVDAVLAHELGHFAHRHILKRLVSIFALSLVGFALLGWLSTQVWFYTGLGVMPHPLGANDALALLLFMLALPAFTTFIGPVFSWTSRRHEFEADAYAVQKSSGAHLASALLKLYEDNASTLTPDPWYVRFYYSHPPALQRLHRMTGALGTA